MKFSTVLFLLTLVTLAAADKCDSCKAAVKAIKDGKGLAYMANLSTKQIEDYIKKNVDKNCTGTTCSKLIKDLIEIADQLDDDMEATPADLCKFTYYC